MPLSMFPSLKIKLRPVTTVFASLGCYYGITMDSKSGPLLRIGTTSWPVFKLRVRSPLKQKFKTSTREKKLQLGNLSFWPRGPLYTTLSSRYLPKLLWLKDKATQSNWLLWLTRIFCVRLCGFLRWTETMCLMKLLLKLQHILRGAIGGKHKYKILKFKITRWSQLNTHKK